MIVFIAILACALIVVFLVMREKNARSEAEKQREFVRAEVQKRQSEIERAEVLRRQELAKKVEVIHEKQVENHDKAIDFDGSINVLSDIASRNRNRN